MSMEFEHLRPLVRADRSALQGVASHQPCALSRALPSSAESSDIVVIEERAFARDCLVKSLRDSRLSGRVLPFSSVDELTGLYSLRETPTIFILSGEHRDPADVEKDCMRLGELAATSPMIILLARDSNADCVLSALRWGVKGYVPVTLSFDLALEAIRVVRAGGIYIPANCLTKAAALPLACSSTPPPLFTSRQMLVVEAMRRGKSNKIIAHELQMAEATVKVHVSNIMRKLKARNRTEVAVMINATN